MTRQQHATRQVRDRIEFTGAKDPDGTPIMPSPADYDRLGGEKFLEHQAWVKEQKEKAAKRRAEEAAYELFRERFVEAGGDPSDARAAFQAKRNAEAAEEAHCSEVAARTTTRRIINSAM